MRIIDVRDGETYEQAEARVKAAKAPSVEMVRLQKEEAPAYVDAENEAVRDGWRIDNIDSLNWALERLGHLERQRDENAAIVERRIALEKLRLEKLNASLERGIAFFESQITAYAQQNRDALLGKGKKKTRDLPHGSVGWKKVPAKAVLKDEAALLEWAKAQPIEEGWVRTKEEPAWELIKAHVEKTGEELPGTEYQSEDEKVVIKPAKEMH
jgi:phage host-nuclease inhibitor protein Gam